MESYLMMLYVTLEQESALKNFFVDQGWMFCKPDLSVTTDKLGPAVQNPPVVSEEISLPETDIPPQMKQTIPEIKINIPPSKPATGTSTVRRGKRKTKSPKQTAIRIKQAKVASASVPEPSESNENLVTEAVESNKSETLDTSKIKVPITVQVEDGNQFTIKIEQESEDVGNDKGEVDNSDVVGNDDFDDGDDDNDEETNVDYSFEGASTSEGDTSVKMESQSLGNNSTNVNTAAKGGSSGKGVDEMEKKKKKRFECGVCRKSYNTAARCRFHTKNEHDQSVQNTVCKVCDKRFSTAYSLNMHQLTIHMGERRYSCTLCDRQFSSNMDLDGHFRQHHDGQKYRCDICGFEFGYKKNFYRHVAICGIAAREQHPCTICEKMFSSKGSLQNHMRAKHSSVVHECALCGNIFERKYSHTRHMKNVHKLD
ncbi:serendipity locus protein delta-like isoform X12 [Mercenaria mercenaria]|uniref:serendipity locus protein delta-like isoform X12 n=1 Tax=Mercenaria mercenaria TaxID=6596 RepID=UPI00234EE354|nr:serendipity locus protein delta-like isoform X12 [Mercenaria mercenaria]